MRKQVIIADDHAVVRTGLQMILDETLNLSIVAEASNGQELLDKLEQQPFDLVILDISMPGKDSLDILKEIKSKWETLPVVIFSMNPDDIFALRMIENGASAYIRKETSPKQIIEILQFVLTGKKYFTQNQSEMLHDMVSRSEKRVPRTHEILTDREFQIFCLLAGGIRKTEIAKKLEISKNTLSNHRNNILKKMNLNMNSELTRYAIQHGIIQWNTHDSACRNSDEQNE